MGKRMWTIRNLVRPGKGDRGGYGCVQRGQPANGGLSNRIACVACWGTTPLPSAVSWAGRPSPGVAVTQPAGRPCIHSTKSARSRPAASVGGGAVRVRVSHRAMAAPYGPHPSLRPSPDSSPPTAAGRLPAGASRCCPPACSMTSCSRPTPSGLAGAIPPRPPDSARDRRTSSSLDAGSRRCCRGCSSGS